MPGAGAPSFSAGAKIVNVDRVEWLVIPDAATAAAALQSGEVDWVEQPLIDLAPLLGRNRDIVVKNFDPFGAVGVVVFNHLHPPIDNPKLRRALLPALNQASYLSAVIGDQAEFKRVDVGVFPPGTPLANGAGLDALTAPRDVALARRLVKQSGYNGERVVLLGPTDYPPDHRCRRDDDRSPVQGGRLECRFRCDGFRHDDQPPGKPGAGGEGRLEHVL